MKMKTFIKSVAGAAAVAGAVFGLSGCALIDSLESEHWGGHGHNHGHHDGHDHHGHHHHNHASSHAVVDTDLYVLEKSVPAMVALGETYEYHYSLRPKHNMMHMSLVDTVPSGASVVSTMPKAEMKGSEMVWGFHDVHANDVIDIMVTMKANEVTKLANCARVEAVPLACTTTCVGEPALSIEKTGPEQICHIGDPATFNIYVENTGNYPAHDVVIKDRIPSGLEHASGSKTLMMNVGTLMPGDHVHECITLTAMERGNFCNVAEVTSSNAGTGQAQHCVNVVQPGVAVRKSGPSEQYVDKRASYTIVATNTGDTTLAHVEVCDTLPSHYELLSATDGYHMHGNTLTWYETDMAAGASKTYEVEVTNGCAGEFCNEARATADHMPSVTDEVCTLWKGFPALLLETVDNHDPLLIGEETTYIIRVTNQGTALDRNISITANIPSELEGVSAAGPVSHRMSGNKVMFDAVPVLNPGQSVEYRVVARAVGLGDARFIVDLNSDLLDEDLTEEESTHVY